MWGGGWGGGGGGCQVGSGLVHHVIRRNYNDPPIKDSLDPQSLQR